MSNFIDNDTALPGTKVNATPPSGPANQQLQATEFNTITQALYDTRTVILRETSIMSYGADPTGVTSSNTALSAAIAALPSGGTIHLPVGNYLIGGSFVVPANITLNFDKSTITTPNGVSIGIEISGGIVAPDNQQIFICGSSSANPVLIYGGGPVSAMWFGAKGDGATDDTVAIQNCFTAMGDQEAYGTGWKAEVFFPTGSYNISSALTLPNFCTIRGERSVINGTNPSANLFNLQEQAAITNMQFVGGAIAIQFQNSDLSGNQYNIDLCWFFSQNVACIYSFPTAASIVAIITRCQFNPPAVPTANIIVSSVDKIILEGCEMNPWELTGPAIVMNWGKMKIKDLLGAPVSASPACTWVQVQTADGIVSNPTTLELESCRFGGESAQTIVNWNASPGNGEDSFLSVKNCTLFSGNNPMFIFNSLPQYVEIIGNTAQSGFPPPGIQFTQSITDLELFNGSGYHWTIQGEIPLSCAGVVDVTDILLINRGNDLNKESLSLTSSQLVTTGQASAFNVSQLTNCSYTAAGSSGVNNEYGQSLGLVNDVVSTTIAVGSNGQSLPQTVINVASTTGFATAGTTQIVVETSNGTQYVPYGTTSGGNQFTGCSSGTGMMTTGNTVAGVPVMSGSWPGILNGLSAGLYTATFELVLNSPAQMAFAGPAVQYRNWDNLHTGKHIFSYPFSITPAIAGATAWIPNHTGYTVGSIVYVDVTGDRFPVLEAIIVPAGGETGSTFTPYDGIGVQFVDGTGPTAITWQCIGSLDLGFTWQPVSPLAEATLEFGRCRVFSGITDARNVNTTVIGSAAPTSGYWQVGDIVYNSAPTPSSNVGWLCTTTGSPGTWTAWGAETAASVPGGSNTDIQFNSSSTFGGSSSLTWNGSVLATPGVLLPNTETISGNTSYPGLTNFIWGSTSSCFIGQYQASVGTPNSGYWAIYGGSVTPTNNNFSILGDLAGTGTYINASSTVFLNIGNADVIEVTSGGLAVYAGSIAMEANSNYIYNQTSNLTLAGNGGTGTGVAAGVSVGSFFAVASGDLLSVANGIGTTPVTTIDQSGDFTTAATIKTVGTTASSAENLLPYSQSFNSGGWGTLNLNSATYTALSPDGSSTAATITDSATAAAHIVFQSITYGSGTYTASIYFQAGTMAYAVLFGDSNTTTSYAGFHLVGAGAVAYTGGSKYLSSTITALNNNWYYCTITYTGTNNAASTAFGTSSPTTYSYSGSSTTITAWGMQIQTGSSATPYISTGSVAVTQPTTPLLALSGAFADLYTGNLAVNNNISVAGIVEQTNTSSPLTLQGNSSSTSTGVFINSGTTAQTTGNIATFENNGVPVLAVNGDGHIVTVTVGTASVGSLNAGYGSTGSGIFTHGGDVAGIFELVPGGTGITTISANTALFTVTLGKAYSSTAFCVLIQPQTIGSASDTGAYYAIPGGSGASFTVYCSGTVLPVNATAYLFQFITFGAGATY